MCGIFIGLALTLVALPAFAQTEDENRANCQSDNPDISISGCTALIQPGHEATAILAGAYQNRGTAYSAKELYDQAIADYTEAITLQPDNAVIYVLRGIAYDDNNRDLSHSEPAIADYSKAIALQPAPSDLAFAYDHRGTDYQSELLNDQAIADYRAALRVDPNNEEALAGLKILGAAP